jgi:hypothetical protein
MLVVASGASVPMSAFAALDPPKARDWPGMVARHIGVIGEGHRFRSTAAAGVCSTDARGGREEYHGEHLQHQGSLMVCSITGLIGDAEPLLAKSNGNVASKFHSMTITAVVTIAGSKFCWSWDMRKADQSSDS